MAGTLRERRKLLLREEIMKAAQELVGKHGYTAMSMDELAAQVGISKPTLYAHFQTKEDLVIEAAIQEIQEVLKMLTDSNDSQSPMERLRGVMRILLRRHVQLYTLGIGPWSEIFRILCTHEQAIMLMQQLDSATRTIVQQAIDAGEIDRTLDPESVVFGFYGLASALSKVHLAHISVANPNQVADQLLEIFERGVRPRLAA
ncbi:MAG: TetR/AcrR family transcriptional regulator [Roseiflexaceae bacterium]